jgi:prephenate dehydrogenase
MSISEPLAQQKVLIIGAGLMGSSLALALRGQVRALYGVDSDPENVRIASGYFDTIATDFDFVPEADLIILAVPVRSIIRLIPEVAALAKPGALLMDIGSTKQEIVATFNTIPSHLYAVGGHPMCGKEVSGPSAADGGLYQGCRFVLSPTERSNHEALVLAAALVAAVGGNLVVLDPRDHDWAVAAISNLPYMASASLVLAVRAMADLDGVAWELAASGFRDTSRIAGSSVTMLTDILSTNREAALEMLALLQAELAQFEQVLSAGDDKALHSLLLSVRETRLWWARKRGI